MFNFKIGAKSSAKNSPSKADSASLKVRLSRSRKKLGSAISSLLLGKKTIDEDLFEALEALLIGADIGIQTTEKLLESLRKTASRSVLKNQDSLVQLLKSELAKLLPEDSAITPIAGQTLVILVIGVNGAGKTTTIGKLAKSFQNAGKTVMLAAGDTFRAAAVDQLKIWGERNQIPVVAQPSGADSASVIYDAYQSALAKNIDILIADTAGRLHTQDNLMQELAKIKRVLKKNHSDAPHETMLVIDGGSGQNALVQAIAFHRAIGVDSLSVTKLDGTAKGGVLFAIADCLKLPIRYIGVGEGIDDLRAFQATEFIEALFED